MNSQYFSAEQIESGEFQKFLRCLMDMSYGSGTNFNDIHIFPEDCGAFTIEWEENPWSHDWGGRFEYVDSDQCVMTEYTLPNHETVMLSSDEEFDEYLKEWLNTHPGWVKTSYGMWTNEIENEQMQKALFDGDK